MQTVYQLTLTATMITVLLTGGVLSPCVTTAATLWFTTLMGFCFGAGEFLLGGWMLGLGVFVLWCMQWIEARWRSRHDQPGRTVEAPAYRHAFTHFDLTLLPWVLSVPECAHAVAESDDHVWYDPRRPPRIGLTKPAVELMQLIATGLASFSQDSM